MSIDSNYQVRLIGYCSVGEESLLDKFIKEGPSGLTDLRGAYVIVIENPDECYIITSHYGAWQYYYAVQAREFFHGDTVLEVLEKSRLPWTWNWRALADVTFLEHVLENDTLHNDIYRVPPGSVLHFRDGELTLISRPWSELHPTFRADPQAALDAFNDETAYWISPGSAVSMSGGFDSRVILSSLLKAGCRPLLFVMGFPDSTDVVISRQIASRLNLELAVVTLNQEDYLRHGSRIVGLSNGTLTAWHWHSYLYPMNLQQKARGSFFLGTAAEVARTIYFDKGIKAYAASLAPSLSLRLFWKPRLHSIFKEEELGSLRGEFSDELNRDGQHLRLRRIMWLCHNKLLSGLDRFYLEQRVRNFMGNGLKLYSEYVSCKLPFLSNTWISTIWNLKRSWKLGSNWHRFAIAENYPQLLDFPITGKRGLEAASKMYPMAPLFYWASARKSHALVPYEKCTQWFQSDVILDFIRDNATLLSELVREDTVRSIVDEHRRAGSRSHAVAFLLTMIFWIKNLRSQCLG